MQGNSRSATAYGQLATITNASNHAARVAHDWLKLSRAIRDLEADLKLNEPPDSPLFPMLAEWRAIVAVSRNGAADVAERLSSDAISLNEKIQNGVFNE